MKREEKGKEKVQGGGTGDKKKKDETLEEGELEVRRPAARESQGP
jgi:hypothetical protein